jgi:hypothetical protein
MKNTKNEIKRLKKLLKEARRSLLCQRIEKILSSLRIIYWRPDMRRSQEKKLVEKSIEVHNKAELLYEFQKLLDEIPDDTVNVRFGIKGLVSSPPRFVNLKLQGPSVTPAP